MRIHMAAHCAVHSNAEQDFGLTSRLQTQQRGKQASPHGGWERVRAGSAEQPHFSIVSVRKLWSVTAN